MRRCAIWSIMSPVRLGTLLLLITVLGSIASPLLVYLFAPGFWDEPIRFQLTADMLRITFPYLFFHCTGRFCRRHSEQLQQIRRAGVHADHTQPVPDRCGDSGCPPLFDIPLMALAWGVAAAGVLQLLLQFPSLVKLHLLPKPRLKRHHEGVSRILRLMLPAVVGSSVAQINLLLDTIIASFLTIGSVTWLYYSDRMLEFPLGVLGIAIATRDPAGAVASACQRVTRQF